MGRSIFTAGLLPLLALTLAVAGCDSNVVGGGDDGEESYDETDVGQGDDGYPEDGEVGCCVGADCCEPQDPTSLAYAETQGDSVRLVFSSGALSCGAEPFMPEACTDQEEYWLDVTIPLSRLVPGTIQLDEPGIESFGNSQGAARSDDPEDCWWGGGSGLGSIEILAVDAASVQIRTVDALGTLDGPSTVDFTASRCGDDPPVEPPVGSYALAFTLPMSDEGGGDDGGSSSQTGGNPGAEDRFVVQIANHTAATCEDRYAMPECPYEAREVSVSIPASRNFVGSVIDLGDESNYVGFSEQGSDGDGECWWGGGSGPLPGTMTIDAAGQGTLDVTFAGTGDALVEGSHTVVVCE